MTLESTQFSPAKDQQPIPLATVAVGLIIAGAIALVANWVATGVAPHVALPGLAILIGLSLAGLFIGRIVPFRLPDIAWITLVTILVTLPGSPVAMLVAVHVAKVGFLPLASPVLAYAGLALSPAEFCIARRSGWKIVVVAVCVMFGTYLGSVVIADGVLRITG